LTTTSGPTRGSERERELVPELAESLTVRVEDLDLPVVLTADSAELRYSPREYLETFSIRT
jgi:hypothetical protein